jgi:hypothetical protein
MRRSCSRSACESERSQPKSASGVPVRTRVGLWLMRREGGRMPSPRLATPSTLLLPAPLAQGLPRGAWNYQWSFFDPQRGAWRAGVETHQAALAAASAAPAAAAAALVIMVVRVARPILVIEGHGTLRDVHAVGCAARRAWSEGRVHVHLEIRRGHRVATAAAAAAIAAIAAIAAAAAVAAAVGAEAEASEERGL